MLDLVEPVEGLTHARTGRGSLLLLAHCGTERIGDDLDSGGFLRAGRYECNRERTCNEVERAGQLHGLPQGAQGTIGEKVRYRP